MKHRNALSVGLLALSALALQGHAHTSPAPEAAAAPAPSANNAAQSGVTGNDGSKAGSDGADSRSGDVPTRDDHEAKPASNPIGDKTDFSGNEGAEESQKGASGKPGTGHGTATHDSGTTSDGNATGKK